MRRREALKNSAFLVGYGISIGSLSTVVGGCKPSLPSGKYYDGKKLQLLSSIADTFLPKTDTPSASEAGVVDYIDTNIEAGVTAEELEAFNNALELVENRSQDKYGKSFVKISEEEKEDLLLSMHSTDLEAFATLQGAVLYVYYTSEAGATQALSFLPVPGEYIACMPLEDVGKAWAL